MNFDNAASTLDCDWICSAEAAAGPFHRLMKYRLARPAANRPTRIQFPRRRRTTASKPPADGVDSAAAGPSGPPRSAGPPNPGSSLEPLRYGGRAPWLASILAALEEDAHHQRGLDRCRRSWRDRDTVHAADAHDPRLLLQGLEEAVEPVEVALDLHADGLLAVLRRRDQQVVVRTAGQRPHALGRELVALRDLSKAPGGPCRSPCRWGAWTGRSSIAFRSESISFWRSPMTAVSCGSTARSFSCLASICRRSSASRTFCGRKTKYHAPSGMAISSSGEGDLSRSGPHGRASLRCRSGGAAAAALVLPRPDHVQHVHAGLDFHLHLELAEGQALVLPSRSSL